MLNTLPTKTNIIYGVGIPATSELYQDNSFYAKNTKELKTLLKLKNKFDLSKENLKVGKTLIKKRELSLIDYSDILLGICSKLITRSVLTYTDRRDELNQFGKHIKKIKNAVDYSKVLEVGTLSQFYSKGSDLFSTVEGTLKNYYNSLSLDYTLTPIAKHTEIIKKLELDKIKWGDVYNEIIEQYNVESINSIASNNLITIENFNFLKVKFTLLLLSESEFNYFKHLQINNKITTKLIDLFYNTLQFDLIGSMPRFYLALLLESLLTLSIYIKTLPELIVGIPINVFLDDDDNLDIKSKLVDYMRLSSEITFILSRFKIFKEMDDLNKVITKDYIKLGQYLYTKEINKEYSLEEYYAGV